MKKTIIITILILTTSFTAGVKEFCQGWDKGYVEGYCYNDPTCLEPIPPVCPVPYLDFNTYTDGYNRGFMKGREDREERDSMY